MSDILLEVLLYLGNGNLVLVFLLVLSKLGALEVGLRERGIDFKSWESHDGIRFNHIS